MAFLLAVLGRCGAQHHGHPHERRGRGDVCSGQARLGLQRRHSRQHLLRNQRSRGDHGRIETIQADAAEAVSAIGRIGQTMGHINEIQTSLAAAVEEQSAATRDISRGVNREAQFDS